MIVHPLRLGASTWTYLQTCDLHTAMRRLRQAGFSQLDVLTIPPHLWPSDLDEQHRRELRQIARAEDFVIESLNLPSTDQNLCSVTSEMRDYSVARWHDVLDLCEALGVGAAVMVPGRRPNFVPPPSDHCDRWLHAALEQLVPHAERAGVKLMLENHHQSPMPTVRQMAGFLDGFGSSQVGIAYDVANGVFVGEDHADAIQAAGRWLLQVHLSDASRTKWDHAAIGRSEIDFRAVSLALQAAGFGGTSIVEVISDNADVDMADARQRLAHLGWQCGTPKVVATTWQ